MRLRISAPRLELGADTRLAIERRVRLALGRHAAGIDRARVTLAPSPSGRPELRCRISLRPRQGQNLTVEDFADDARSAAIGAAHRLENRLESRRAVRGGGFAPPPRRSPPYGEGSRR